MRLAFAVAPVALASAAVAAAQDAPASGANPPANQAKSAAAEPAQDKVVCRRAPPTGSMIPKKVCRTVRSWNALAEATRTELQQGANSGGTNSN